MSAAADKDAAVKDAADLCNLYLMLAREAGVFLPDTSKTSATPRPPSGFGYGY